MNFNFIEIFKLVTICVFIVLLPNAGNFKLKPNYQYSPRSTLESSKFVYTLEDGRSRRIF